MEENLLNQGNMDGKKLIDECRRRTWKVTITREDRDKLAAFAPNLFVPIEPPLQDGSSNEKSEPPSCVPSTSKHPSTCQVPEDESEDISYDGHSDEYYPSGADTSSEDEDPSSGIVPVEVVLGEEGSNSGTKKKRKGRKRKRQVSHFTCSYCPSPTPEMKERQSEEKLRKMKNYNTYVFNSRKLCNEHKRRAHFKKDKNLPDGGNLEKGKPTYPQYFCKICDTSGNAKNERKHQNTEKHKRNEKNLKLEERIAVLEAAASIEAATAAAFFDDGEEQASMNEDESCSLVDAENAASSIDVGEIEVPPLSPSIEKQKSGDIGAGEAATSENAEEAATSVGEEEVSLTSNAGEAEPSMAAVERAASIVKSVVTKFLSD